jgi:ATP-dependent Clp protease adaptor protein ClpS
MHSFPFTQPEIEEVACLDETSTSDQNELIVYNDDVNTFQHVINTLIRVCGHSAEQAEQCTLIIHYKGKCSVKLGTFTELLPMRQGLCDQGISAEIE